MIKITKQMQNESIFLKKKQKQTEDREAEPLAPRYTNGAPGEVGSNSSGRGRRVWFHLQESMGELKN